MSRLLLPVLLGLSVWTGWSFLPGSNNGLHTGWAVPEQDTSRKDTMVYTPFKDLPLKPTR